ncbi:type IV pilin-like G/H family protein [Microcoleus sp. AS-A8]
MALQATSRRSEGTVQKARYGRIGGLALLQYAAIVVFAVAVPTFVVYREGCKSCQGKSGLRIINRAQQSYFLKHQQFADSVQSLAIGIKNPTENYEYSTRVTPLAVFNYATSRQKAITSYVGGVFLESANNGTDELVTIALACEPILLDEVSDVTEPIVHGNVLECGSNTQLLNRTPDNETGRIILSKDSALAYNSVNYAVTGQYNQALVVAEAIDSSPLKEKALKAITRSPNTNQQVQASPSLSQALEIAKTIPDDDIKAWVLTDIAQKYAVAGQPSQAMEILSQALEVANTLQDADTKAMLWADISQQYAVAGKKSTAVGILSHRAENTEGDR